MPMWILLQTSMLFFESARLNNVQMAFMYFILEIVALLQASKTGNTSTWVIGTAFFLAQGSR